MRGRHRFRIASISAAAALLAALAIGVAASQAVDPGTSFDHTYTTVGETQFVVPAGVTAMDVVATGGRGASVSNINSNPVSTAAGGLGARVNGRLSGLTPAQSIYLEVGGNGSNGDIHSPGQGGYNGGGDATVGSTSSNQFFNPGGGGGGASDIRTIPFADGLTTDTRLIVASGGGGGGHTVNSSSATGGDGGAGWGGIGATGAGGARGASSGGGGGSGGSGGGGGAAGSAGTGAAGTMGNLGLGGNGGTGPNNDPAGGGGGGGGGRYGGGGGRGGSSATGGGGGGGGSSLIPLGGGVGIAPDGSSGSIEISYTVPGTDMDSGPVGSTSDTTPSFGFSSGDGSATFECRIDSANVADFAPCTSSYTPPALSEGTHRVDVRAVNSMGNFDPSPATRPFTVDTVPPTTTITSGPNSSTTNPVAMFTYTAESGSTFACAIDSAAPASCPANGFASAPLALGAHTFSVRATDAAGNVEATPVTRSFAVVASPPARAKCKKKKHKRAVTAKKGKCKKRKGIGQS